MKVSMNLPKRKLLRAIHKAGLATPAQITKIDRKISQDRPRQQAFLALWRLRSGSRFSGGLSSFMGWVRLHWDEIKIALGIVALFLDDESEEVVEPQEVKKPKTKPKPKTKTKVEAKVETKNPWVIYTKANKVKDSNKNSQ